MALPPTPPNMSYTTHPWPFARTIMDAWCQAITSGVTEARCTRDPREWCRYNDNVPFMATVAMIFSGLMLTRALLVWFYRPVKSTHGFFDEPPSHTERRDHRTQG